MPKRPGSFFIFRLFGVNVFLHWSWALAALLRIWGRLDVIGLSGNKHGVGYGTAWVLVLFGIVLLHEFGHALACKSVGGVADTIVLSPLGGAAYVDPPQRPGAMLWSIFAGPLVNIVLLPLTLVPAMMAARWHLSPDLSDFAWDIVVTNILLLVFNMLPAYPLDGGKILWSLLWFIFGRSVSLIISAVVGLAGAAAVGLLAILSLSLWTGLIAFFMGSQALAAIRIGLSMQKLEKAPRHFDVRCPYCLQNPPVAVAWRCKCGLPLDTFEHNGQCPQCGTAFATTMCPYCGKSASMDLWRATKGFPVVQGNGPHDEIVVGPADPRSPA